MGYSTRNTRCHHINKCDLQRLVSDILLFEKRYPCILTSYLCTTFVFILATTNKLLGVIYLAIFFH
jgi:hypothetical protein